MLCRRCCLGLWILVLASVSLGCGVPAATGTPQPATSTREVAPETETPAPTSTPASERRCGDGVCDGPETAARCPEDCQAGTAGSSVRTPAATDGEAPAATEGSSVRTPAATDGETPAATEGSSARTPAATDGEAPVATDGREHWVTNPASGAELFVRVVMPLGWDGVTPLPALVLIPGGSGAGSTFLVEEARGSQAQLMADQGALAIVVFDPDGRGQSGGGEDHNGFVHQDGLAAVVRYAATLPEVDRARIGLVSYSYGVTMATGALARHPDLPVVFLIDFEGPANRDDTGGCDSAGVGHLRDVGCDDEAFWAEREASTFVLDLPVPYQRLQSRDDHVQPDLAHALLMVANATASAYGGNGVAPWTRLNDLQTNQVWTAATLPELPPSGSAAVRDAVGYAVELFAIFAPPGVPVGGIEAAPGVSGTPPLFMTTMTHMEGGHTDDRDRHVFDTHVAQLRYGLALANEYGARFTVESEKPFARACAKYGVNMLQEVLDLGHGVGTHADVGFNNPPPNVSAMARELRQRKALVDALVGPEHNRGVSGAGGVNDWVLAADQAGFAYVDGVVGMHYLAMPPAARPDVTWTDEYIRAEAYHDPAPVDFLARITPFMMRDARDFEPDPDGVILLSSGEIGRLDAMAEGGSPVGCIRGECPLTEEDITALLAVIAEADAVRDPSRVAKLTLYLPAKLFDVQHEAQLRAFLAATQALVEEGILVWGTQGDVYDAYVAWHGAGE